MHEALVPMHRPPMARRPAAGPGLAALVLLVHLLAWWWWPAAVLQVPVAVSPTAPTSGLLWLRRAEPVAAPQKAAAVPDASRHRVPGPPPAATVGRATPAATAAPTATPPPDATAGPAPAPADAVPGPAPGAWLDNAATRQAIRDAAKGPLLSERHAAAIGQPLRSGEARLAEAAASSAKGDCLQGQFAGAGAGLLSLPFLAVAAARGQCAR